MSTLTETLLTGADLVTTLDDLASLRLAIFEEYPYLYQGKRSDELAYLRSYAEKPGACVIVVRDGEQIVGAATGMPLVHEVAQLRDAVAEAGMALDEIFYVGELLFLPAWRNRGLGQKLLARIESHILSLGGYHALTCATVQRPADHPLRPDDFIPITQFLARTGFARLPGVTSCLTWAETDGIIREHTMQFWLKDLATAGNA